MTLDFFFYNIWHYLRMIYFQKVRFEMGKTWKRQRKKVWINQISYSN
jgi:hypothetical protein